MGRNVEKMEELAAKKMEKFAASMRNAALIQARESVAPPTPPSTAATAMVLRPILARSGVASLASDVTLMDIPVGLEHVRVRSYHAKYRLLASFAVCDF